MEKKNEHQKPLIFSLKQNCKNRLKGIFYSVKSKSPGGGNQLLILDKRTVRFVSSYFKMMELVEMGITAIEKIELIRKPFPKVGAIYLLSPEEDSVQKLLSDFQKKKTPNYALAHIFFTNKLPKNLMEKIALCSELMSRVKTFKEFNQDFLCSENNLFSLDLPNSLPELFGPDFQQSNIEKTANSLTTILPAFEKFFEIEIIFNEVNKISKNVSNIVFENLKKEIEEMNKKGEEEQENLDKEAGKIVLVILDRTVDPMTPILHDFYYQSMVYDLLEIKDDLVSYEDEKAGKKVNKKALLNENDELFQKYRYKHVAEALDGIPTEFQEFVNMNTLAKVQKGVLNNLDLNKMSEIVKSMPQYNELLSKYTMHMNLIDQCFKIFDQKDLKEIGEIEQSLATGLDKEGKNASDVKIISAVGSRLNSTKLTDLDKLRLAFLVLMTLNITSGDKNAIADCLSEEDRKYLGNLKYLGITDNSEKTLKKASKKVDEKIKKIAKNKVSKATLDLCRHTPISATVVENILENYKQRNNDLTKNTNFANIKLNSFKINENTKGSGNQPKSLRNKGKLGKLMNDDEDLAKSCTKFVIFFIGGISHCEVRCLNSINLPEDIILALGSTSLINPKEYVETIKKF